MCMKRGDCMSSWIADVCRIGFQLSQMGVVIDNEEYILVLTMGLPSSYHTFIGTLENIGEADLTVDYVINQLLNEESRQPNSTPFSCDAQKTDNKNVAMAVTLNMSCFANVICYRCGERGDYQSVCPHAP